MNSKWLKTSVLIGVTAVLAFTVLFFCSGRFSIEAQSFLQLRKVSPAGRLLIDAGTGEAAVMPLTFNFVRTPDTRGPGGLGKFLIAVNSGYGLLTNSKSKPQQTLSVIDLNAVPEPKVVQTVWFPAPQSANVGLVFDRNKSPNGKFNLYVSGGFENKIWILAFDSDAAKPLGPANNPDELLDAPSINVDAFSEFAPTPDYNENRVPVYPTGIGLSPDGKTLFVANNLADNLGVITDLQATRKIKRVSLNRSGSTQFVYPYDVAVVRDSGGKSVSKIFVSLWGDGSVAVVDGRTMKVVKHITVGRHPTKLLLSKNESRLFVVNSDGDSVSVINTRTAVPDPLQPTIKIALRDSFNAGLSPQGLALSADEKRLYVSAAKANAVAVVELATRDSRAKILGFIPTANYPSALSVASGKLMIANGKGSGMENSSARITDSGLYPNMPNAKFPPTASKRGMYSAVVVSGNVSVLEEPTNAELFEYTGQVMRANGMTGFANKNIFPTGRSPFRHVVYVIRENRTYDQVFGDLEKSGNGTRADGDPSVAIFGAGELAKSPSGAIQNITPNARNLALRFGLLDRFFVNAEASPDGHNWSTAAFSNDYVDKAFRWNYSGRGRTYDFEGFNRLPSYDPPSGQPPVALASVFDLPATADDVSGFLRRYVPYLNGARDVAEPETLYLWDLAARNRLSYRTYGEFVATVSAEDVKEVNARKAKTYPDISPTLTAFPTKKALEDHFSPKARNYDMMTPDAMTTDSYLAAANQGTDPLNSPTHTEERFRGSSRLGEFLAEFHAWNSKRASGGADEMPNLTILRLSNDHTAGLRQKTPTPQFFISENDYALGRLVEEISKTEYWKDTAIFVLEDDAQDGPDHVDAHRSPAFVISAYNRRGALIHDFHSTVSLIRTMELCLGLPPMNFLDAHAAPIDIFQSSPDFSPYKAELPVVSADNLFPPPKPSRAMAEYMTLTDRQDLDHADMANPYELNRIIWFSVRGGEPMPAISRMPAYDVLKLGLSDEDEDEDEEHDSDDE